VALDAALLAQTQDRPIDGEPAVEHHHAVGAFLREHVRPRLVHELAGGEQVLQSRAHARVDEVGLGIAGHLRVRRQRRVADVDASVVDGLELGEVGEPIVFHEQGEGQVDPDELGQLEYPEPPLHARRPDERALVAEVADRRVPIQADDAGRHHPVAHDVDDFVSGIEQLLHHAQHERQARERPAGAGVVGDDLHGEAPAPAITSRT
jgi:hypothetical protein